MQTSTFSNLRGQLAAFGKGVRDGARLMVGQPDYDVYLAHMQANHPDTTPMTRVEFFRNRQDARFGIGNNAGFRCC
ncbi:YbdD/YjiX family protein [Marinivivus vitaminiproducens]|uniref:YbdD/YjiX family protein n=1 Tax=Marinivivus vitaminiproducens TaxID=3035935 RepID=UPI0027AB85A7|nr:YbdD/YjiX family protein [Geminicoccaceae bacterium SCSIO 64248]